MIDDDMIDNESRRHIEGWTFLVLLCLTIPAANWMIGNVGTVCLADGPCVLPVAPGVMAPSGVLMVGAALVLRDLVQRRLGAAFGLGAIAVGAAISWALAPAALVIASTAAFLLSEFADFAVYTPLSRRRLVLAVLASSVVGLVVDSLAFLRAGMTPSSTVPCTSELTVDGKKFTNDSDYPASAIGRVPLSTAIANSCNTAVISQRDKVSDEALASAAASLGFGVDHDTGFPAYFGQVPPAASDTEKAADMIGQGKVLASPMTMASVIGAIQTGSATVPRLIAGTELKPSGTPLTASEDAGLKDLFRAVVTRGTGLGLADIPGKPVIAKTGTAEFDRDGKRLVHAWMIAAQGDLAVAVYVDEGVTGAQTAGPIVEAFLRGAGR